MTPIAIFLLPLLMIASLRFRWSLAMFVFSIPWKTAVLFSAISHTFVFPEVALLILVVHLVWKFTHEDIKLPLPMTSVALLGFGLMVVLSMVILLLDPPAGLYGRPYNIQRGYGAFPLVQIEFSLNTITQAILRWFFIGAVVTIIVTFSLREELIPWAVRAIVASALLVGFVGILYQMSVLFGANVVPRTIQSVGFKRFPVTPSKLGPLPRMYSITGEPGATAHFLLFAFTITVTTLLSDLEGMFTRGRALILSGVLFVLILFTTGTTGYGGLLVLAVILFFTTPLTDSLRSRLIVGGGFATIAIGVIGVVAISALTPINLVRIVSLQLEKLTFSTGSGNLRAQYIIHSLSLWANRPVVGIGVGTDNGTSFLASTLAETGLLGGGLLLLSVLYSYRIGILSTTVASNSRGIPLAVAVATVCGTAFVARSMSASLFPWLWIALALPAANGYHVLTPARR